MSEILELFSSVLSAIVSIFKIAKMALELKKLP